MMRAVSERRFRICMGGSKGEDLRLKADLRRGRGSAAGDAADAGLEVRAVPAQPPGASHLPVGGPRAAGEMLAGRLRERAEATATPRVARFEQPRVLARQLPQRGAAVVVDH